jgi:hypothetical protein
LREDARHLSFLAQHGACKSFQLVELQQCEGGTADHQRAMRTAQLLHELAEAAVGYRNVRTPPLRRHARHQAFRWRSSQRLRSTERRGCVQQMGMTVLSELLATEAAMLGGPKGKHVPGRTHHHLRKMSQVFSLHLHFQIQIQSVSKAFDVA